MSYFNTEVINPLAEQYLPILGRLAFNKKAIDEAGVQSKKTIDAVEAYLLNNTFLVGERITLADLFCAGILTRGFQFFYGKEWRQANPNVTRWYETVINQPIYSAVAEKLEFLDEPKKIVAPKKAEAPKPAPKAAPAPAAAAAAADEEPKEAPKPKHPLEALGRATYPIDEWKRHYSNSKDNNAMMKYFWETVIPTGEYSIWRVDYKYPAELTQVFMSNNLIGGFNNRLEGSRKYLFGCAAVYGQDNDSVIQGAFLIRGDKHEPVFDVAPDWESYNFTQLDPSKAEDREFVAGSFGWEKPAIVNGKEYKLADGKEFK